MGGCDGGEGGALAFHALWEGCYLSFLSRIWVPEWLGFVLYSAASASPNPLLPGCRVYILYLGGEGSWVWWGCRGAGRLSLWEGFAFLS